jgi:hypothetical protein
MARYFFHCTDGFRRFTDGTGTELQGVAAVRQHAANQVRELRDAMMSEMSIQDWSDWKVIAVDSAGKTVFEIGFDLKPSKQASNSLANMRL